MSEFSNVTVVKKANIYFDGKVVSHTVQFPDGSKKTLGVMQAGDYEFSTGAAEIMEILSGELVWQMKGELEWQKVVGGEAFDVPANSVFQRRQIISIIQIITLQLIPGQPLAMQLPPKALHQLSTLIQPISMPLVFF